MKLAAPPVAEAARGLGLDVLQPVRASDGDVVERLRGLELDLGVVVAYGEIFRKPLLAAPRLGMFNVHASVLPRWRGASPIQAAIRAGDATTGVTVFRLVRRMDAGPVLLTLDTEIPPDETAGMLHDRLALLGATAVRVAVARLAAEGEATRLVAQDEALVTTCGLISKADGRIDWSLPAADVAHHVCAMTPWPGAQATVADRAGRAVELVVTQARAVRGVGEPGRRIADAHEPLVVACGRDVVSIRRVKPAGRREMSASEFLRGTALAPDARFG